MASRISGSSRSATEVRTRRPAAGPVVFAADRSQAGVVQKVPVRSGT
jgi:hypothetical protein